MIAYKAHKNIFNYNNYYRMQKVNIRCLKNNYKINKIIKNYHKKF